jgi:hypothetical protein
LGTAILACRLDRFLRWLKVNAHSSGQFCAVGQSGGSSALAYTLTHHGIEGKLDGVVLTGGPTMANLTFGCSEDPPCDVGGSAQDGCYTKRNECGIDQAYGNPDNICDPADLSGSSGPCQELDDDPVWIATADEDSLSVVTTLPQKDYGYPFSVHFVFGNDDAGSAPPQGVRHRDVLANGGTATTCQVVGTLSDPVPHNIANEETGATAVYSLLSKYCVEFPDAPDEPDTCTQITPVP